MQKNYSFVVPMIVGIVLFFIGISMKVPGMVLTTSDLLDGKTTEKYSVDDQYSAIDEYVGGDAYNYIIGASLVSGKVTGAMATKAVFIVGGLICWSFGFAFMWKKDKAVVCKGEISDNYKGDNITP